ncbi:MAG: acetate--CoA ligase family protein [Deltaproteobacteria bacterium]|nr:acetate--CoA ligase family protein [Deltaproteobacteria bacterium]
MERGFEEDEEEQRVTDNYSQFSAFFYPKNIAVIGVSPVKNNLGKNIVLNCLYFGYPGEIIPVGLSKGVVYGQRIYESIENIDRDIDLAVILTPAKTIPGILEQCGRKGIKHAVIESGGFSELGKEGEPLEKACVEVARRYGIRFIGPNGIGVTNLDNGLALPFMPLRRDIALGPVSILAQSGGVGLSYLNILAEENIGVNKFVSMGNKLNVDENDLLGYLIQDEGTKIILVYLEGFKDARRFTEVASTSTKPILVHKSNRFEASARIAHSHTAALFADDRLVDYALEQAGCIRLNTMDDSMDYLKSQTLPPLRGNRLVVISRSGGHAVIAADACAHYGFTLPRFPEEILKKVESRLRAHVIRLQNPLDLGDLFELEFYAFIVEEMLKRDDVDGVVLAHGYQGGFEQEASRTLIKRVERLIEQYQKPVACVIFAEALEKNYLRKSVKIPIFSAPENAMRAFNLSYKWPFRKPSPLQVLSLNRVDHEKARDVVSRGVKAGHLLLHESLQLLEHYGFSVPAYALVRTEAEALQFRRTFKGPMAMKINSPHFSHKSDLGAVQINIRTQAEVEKAFRKLTALGGEGTEVLVQSMVTRGREVILGGKRDQSFGPIVLFGLGGIFVEALKDVAWRVAPLSYEETRKMIGSIRGARVLQGIRGEKPCDIETVVDLLVRLSHMLIDLPQIQEIDINPVLVFPEGEGAVAVDARVLLAD